MTNGKTRYRVMVPIKRGEDTGRTFWNRVGTAFENPGKEGSNASIHVILEALPVNGELVLFVDDGEKRSAEPTSEDKGQPR